MTTTLHVTETNTTVSPTDSSTTLTISANTVQLEVGSYSLSAVQVLTLLKTVDGADSGVDADTVDGSHASAFEPALGNPGTDGYVLSSTAAGVRSWVSNAGGGGASDVDDLTTTTGSSTDMLRVAAAGGLEYRTMAQVLSDIGAAPTASPTFTGTVTLPTTVASVIKPASDSTAALQLANAAGTGLLIFDTTTPKLIMNSTTYGVVFTLRYSGSDALRFNVQSTYASIDTINSRSLLLNPVTGLTFTYGKISVGQSGSTAVLDIAASTTATASLRIRSGTAPTSPNAGDLWFDGTNLKFYDGTTTRTLSWT